MKTIAGAIVVLGLLFAGNYLRAHVPDDHVSVSQEVRHELVRHQDGNHCRGKITAEYDMIFKEAARRYGSYPWCHYKAQAFRESSLNPNAVSEGGDKGIAQFQPDTFQQAANAIGGHDLMDPNDAIPAMVWYNEYHAKQWSFPRTDECRWDLMVLSYRAGLGTILDAQRASGGELCPSDNWPLTELSWLYMNRVNETIEEWEG